MTEPRGTTEPRTDRPQHRSIPWVVPVYLLAALPLILSGFNRGRGQFDQEVFHERVIRRFAADWPRVDLTDYLSATTPGYHLLLAIFARFINDSLVTLKLAGALFTVALFWLLDRALRRRLGDQPHAALRTLVLLAPMLASMHVLYSGVWLLPDNAGWLGVAAMLLIALRPKWDWLSIIGGGLIMLALVWVRQSHIWAAGLLWLGAWFSAPDARLRFSRSALALTATVPAILTLLWFRNLWGGQFINLNAELRSRHGASPNLAAPAYALSLWAVFCLFFMGWAWPGVRSLWRTGPGRMIVGACILFGATLAAVPDTTYRYDDPATHVSRATGPLWQAVKWMDAHGITLSPSFAPDALPGDDLAGGTSPLLLVLAPAGLVLLSGWLARLPKRDAWIHGLGLAGFIIVQSANAAAWQRYFEPYFLMVMAIMAATISGRMTQPEPSRWMRRAQWAGPLKLAALGALLTAFTLFRGVTVEESLTPEQMRNIRLEREQHRKDPARGGAKPLDRPMETTDNV